MADGRLFNGRWSAIQWPMVGHSLIGVALCGSQWGRETVAMQLRFRASIDQQPASIFERLDGELVRMLGTHRPEERASKEIEKPDQRNALRGAEITLIAQGCSNFNAGFCKNRLHRRGESRLYSYRSRSNATRAHGNAYA